MQSETQTDENGANALKSRLDVERRELIEEINRELTRGTDSEYTQHINEVRDRGDESVADLYSDIELAVTGHHLQRLHAVEDALQRMKNGTYGSCTDCGQPIDQNRLNADPAAARCIGCQSKIESQPQAKDPTPSL